MKKKSAMILLLSFFLIIISSNVVSVSPPTDIFEWFSESQTWPPYPPGGSNDEFPRWYIGLIWLALGSVVFMTASKLFEKIHHKNAIIALAFAFSGIAVGGTGFVQGVASIIGFGVGGLSIIGVIAGVSLFIGLLGGSFKLAGGGLKLGASGVEAAKEAKEDITGERKDENVEKHFIANLEQMESEGLKDVGKLIEFVQEIQRLLSDQTVLKNKALRGSLANKISSLNDVIRSLGLHTSNIQRVTRAIERLSMDEIRKLQSEMIAARNAATPAGTARTPTTAQIQTYVNNLRAQFITDYRADMNMASVETRLIAAEKALRRMLSTAVAQLNVNNIVSAKNNFGQASRQLQEIGSELSELERIEHGIEARLQAETRSLSALDHLTRI